jgi:hypothetical protein
LIASVFPRKSSVDDRLAIRRERVDDPMIEPTGRRNGGDRRIDRARAHVAGTLRQAQTLGSTLRDYAEAFSLNVNDLYNGKSQLQRKGGCLFT